LSINSEVARILAEEGVEQLGKPLDLSVCALMSFDHWDPADICSLHPASVVAALDDAAVMEEVAAVMSVEMDYEAA
jgi:hypothetical protein